VTDIPAASAVAAPPPAPSNAQVAIAGIATVSDAELLATADRLVARGVDAARVREIVHDAGVEWEPDSRSPEQREHDRLHAVDPRGTPRTYSFPLPPQLSELGVGDAHVQAANLGAQSIANTLGMDANQGAKFCRQIIDAAAEVRAMSPEEVAETSARWETQLTEIYGADLPAVAAAVTEMVKLNDSVLAKHLTANGILASEARNPKVFCWLASRAAARSLWSSTRPR
jgi:hypothetical protein